MNKESAEFVRFVNPSDRGVSCAPATNIIEASARS
jgi:hypothetical protein